MQLSYITILQHWRVVHLNHNTTTVACCQVASKYHNSGVLSSCIKIPQQWRAVKLHHNKTVACSHVASLPQQWRAVHLNHITKIVVCCQDVSKYQNSGVLSSCSTIPQQWRAVSLGHITATKVSNLLKIYYKTESFITHL